MTDQTAIFCGDNCNHLGPHHYPPGPRHDYPKPAPHVCPPSELDAAWRRVEAALPEGWVFETLRRRYAGSSWHATAVLGGIGQQDRSKGTVPTNGAHGPTPATALIALAEKLEALDGPR